MFKLIAVAGLLVAVAWFALPTRSVPGLDGRIAGGNDAVIDKYPYQVSLQHNGDHMCGGAIIGASWILTAAHCTNGYSPSEFTIRAGTADRRSGGQVVAVSRIINHPNYKKSAFDYDIALLHLSLAISSEKARAIALPPSGSPPSPGATTTITGWGRLKEGGDSPIHLQVIQVPVISQADCRSAHGSSSITDGMFCAGIVNAGGKDACHGDSGSPAVVGGVLAGIVSWGRGCARPGYPGVYTNVAHFRSWIKDNSGI